MNAIAGFNTAQSFFMSRTEWICFPSKASGTGPSTPPMFEAPIMRQDTKQLFTPYFDASLAR